MDSINLTYERFKENNDTETFYKRLDKIELSAISNLTDKEEVIILSQTSVSRALTQYWTTKFQKWLDNTNVSTPEYDRPLGYWGNVAKADGKGAVAVQVLGVQVQFLVALLHGLPLEFQLLDGLWVLVFIQCFKDD